MWRLPLLAIAICLTLQASSIVSYTCTLGTTIANPCPETGFGLGKGLALGNAQTSAFAQVSEPTLENITVHAASTASFSPCVGCPPQPSILAASAQAVLDDTDYTIGPVRSGFILITENIYSLHALPATGWSISDGSNSYGGCLPGGHGVEGCSGTETLPFQLGVPFTVVATATDGVSVTPPQTGFGQEDEVDLTFSLFEADGTTPVAVLPTPEPSTYALLFCGMGLLPVFLLGQRCCR